ncbi:MAG: repeat domain protein [Myxococcaceae bacterium]|nr:repeat domain protein [Myxococcaceae bacterium]
MPYRHAPLSSLSASGRGGPRGPVLLAFAVAAAGEPRLARSIRERPWPGAAGARAAELPGAVTMAGGRNVTVLRGEGAGATVVRLPGALVRRGTDVLRVPEVLPARGAVALMPDGAWAIDSEGAFFDVSSAPAIAACARRPCVAQRVPGHGRVVQVTGGGGARLEDGAVSTRWAGSPAGWRVDPAWRHTVDLSDLGGWFELLHDGDVVRRHQTAEGAFFGDDFRSPGLRVPEPVDLVTNVGSDPICVRGARGHVRCGVIADHLNGCIRMGPSMDAFPVRPWRDAARIAVGGSTVCVVDTDDRLACGDVPYRYGRPDTSAGVVLAPVAGVDRARDVALSPDAGCARDRSGAVRCWGPVLRDRGVVRRDAPVTIQGLDAAERLVAFRGYLCALQRDVVWCWGGTASPLLDRPPTAAPRPLATNVAVRELAATHDHLCITLATGEVRCWEGDPFATSPQWLVGAPRSLHSLVLTDRALFALDDDSQAWASELSEGAPPTLARLPAFDAFKRILYDEGWTCALRAGAVQCPSPVDASGVNDGGYDDGRPTLRDRQRQLLARVDPVARPPLQVLPSPRLAERLRPFGLPLDALGGVLPAAGPLEQRQLCVLGTSGRVACRWRHDGLAAALLGVQASDEAFAVVPDLADAVELATTQGGLACARRASGDVACWGANTGSALTAADSDSAPVTLGLEEILARAYRPTAGPRP